jgi:hypothetical protein
MQIVDFTCYFIRMHLPNLVVVVITVENKDFSVLYRKTIRTYSMNLRMSNRLFCQ